ncbi:MAG: rod-binding protein [Alphaproteobacteria bacterium]
MDAFSLQTVVDNTLSQAGGNKLESLNKLSSTKDLCEAKETAKDFEAFFISQMMEQMFSSIPTDGMFGGGHAEKVYRSMMLDEYGKDIAANGGIGIADQVVKFMIDTQNQFDNSQGV